MGAEPVAKRGELRRPRQWFVCDAGVPIARVEIAVPRFESRNRATHPEERYRRLRPRHVVKETRKKLARLNVAQKMRLECEAVDLRRER